MKPTPKPTIKASLTLNHKDELALFYDEPLGVIPEWASIDIENGEIYIGGEDVENKLIHFDHAMKREVYDRVQQEAHILLVLLQKGGDRAPLEAITVPLTVVKQL